MRHVIWLLLVVALTGCQRKLTPKPIWIGHLAPLSGPQKILGDHAKQGIQLAIDAVNTEENFIAGRHIGVVHVDTRGEVEIVQPEAVRLITVNHAVALLGCPEMAQVERLARILPSYGTPLVTPSVLPPQLPNALIFTLRPAPTFYAQVLVRFVGQELKAGRIRLVSDSRGSFGTTLTEAFAREFPKADSPRVETESYRSNSDLATIAGRIAETKPDVVIFAGSIADFLKLRLELPGKGTLPTFLYASESEDASVLLADRDRSKDVYAVTVYAADASGTANAEFAKKYQDSYHELPDAAAAISYDGVRLLIEGMKRAKVVPDGRIRDEIDKLESFDSLTGPLTMSKKDHYARRPLFIVRLGEGRLTTVKRYEPEKE